MSQNLNMDAPVAQSAEAPSSAPALAEPAAAPALPSIAGGGYRCCSPDACCQPRVAPPLSPLLYTSGPHPNPQPRSIVNGRVASANAAESPPPAASAPPQSAAVKPSALALASLACLDEARYTQRAAASRSCRKCSSNLSPRGPLLKKNRPFVRTLGVFEISAFFPRFLNVFEHF